ncbi:hypothetical protein TM48_02239 [Mycobacterium shottsii]|nr:MULTISPECIES: hypothetical protein [Mycobacterium ulcerans group]QYL27963.1 hypothetical protein TM48_02239 [Mycobacterium shottsii]
MPHPPLGLNGFGLLTEFGNTAAHRVGAGQHDSSPSRRRYRVG